MRTLVHPGPLVAGLLRIEGDEAHHGRSVLRLDVGDRLRLADGAGQAAEGVITAVGRHHLEIQAEVPVAVEDGPARLITVALAPPKGDRLADTVRGLTELGVGTIQLLKTERGERLPSSLDRLERIAAEALKQCRRGCLPHLAPPIPVADLALRGGTTILLDPAGGPAHPGPPAPVTLVIGPEGGLTDEEIATLTTAGAGRVRLARPILRIETAALAAAAVWTSAWELP